jgi:hypothetical protein
MCFGGASQTTTPPQLRHLSWQDALPAGVRAGFTAPDQTTKDIEDIEDIEDRAAVPNPVPPMLVLR